jgi:uncharacterized protein with HEPN domain
MEKDPGIYLRHILEAIANIEADTAGYDFGKFRVDRRARQLVERNLEILSEASRRLPKELKEGEAHVPWRAIAGIGNVLRHDYHETYPTILWETCQKDLETLKEAVGRIARRVSTVPRRKPKKA